MSCTLIVTKGMRRTGPTRLRFETQSMQVVTYLSMPPRAQAVAENLPCAAEVACVKQRYPCAHPVICKHDDVTIRTWHNVPVANPNSLFAVLRL